MRVGSNHFRVHERRPAVLAAVVDCAPHHGERFQRIGAVTSLDEKIGKTSDEFGNVAAGRLHFDRHADRVAVVFAQEHHWQFKVAGRVERFPKLAFARSAVAQRNVHDFVITKILNALFQFFD